MTDSAGIIVVDNLAVGQWPEGQAWRVQVDIVIGQADGDDAYAFGRIGDVALDRHGQFFVLDELAQEVKVYDAAGTFVRRIGGPGEGPGELSQAVASIFVSSSDTLYVTDAGQKRVNVYGPDGVPARTVRLPQEMTTTVVTWVPADDRRFLSRTIASSSGFYVRAYLSSLPPRASDMLAARTGQWTAGDSHP